jgi:hypothetical protein
MNPTPLILEQLQKLDPIYTSFLMSESFEETVDLFSEAKNLSSSQADSLQNGLLLALAFLLDRQQLVAFVGKNCGFGTAEAELLWEGFLQSLPPNIINYYQGMLELENDDITNDLAEIEQSLHQINPVRTMAGDGKQIGYSSTTEDIYTSTQSAIINESK